MANTFKETIMRYEDLEELDEWLTDVQSLESKLTQPRKIRPDEVNVLQKRKKAKEARYLGDFVKMQEYKWQSKFKAAQADRMRKRLKNHGPVFL